MGFLRRSGGSGSENSSGYDGMMVVAVVVHSVSVVQFVECTGAGFL